MMFAAAVMGISGRQSFSQTVSRVELHAVQTTTPPKLDGVLDETVWTSEPMLLEGWASYNPLRGEPARQRTSVWIAYDADALYFAFRCFDEEPSKIRTTITRRDNAWNDDWIAVSLDWAASLLRSDTRTPDGVSIQGTGGQAKYDFSTRRALVMGQVEHYDRGFRMDTAFINRVGLSRAWQYEEVNFYPVAQYGWIKRIAPFLWNALGEDRLQGGDEALSMPGVRFNFVRQGDLRLDMSRGHETFAGRRFDTGRAHADGRAQITRWLNVAGTLERADAVFYDPADPFPGIQFTRNLNLEWQPNARLAHNLSYNFVRFERSDGENVFTVHIVNLRNTYQFTPRFFIRAIAQFDNAKHRLLGDFLASYELMPGTVAHAGYGSIVESINSSRYTTTARALFFKVSYLARL